MSDYRLVRQTPSVEDYLRVRKAARLGVFMRQPTTRDD